jgi:hypothetical protein
MSNIQDHLIAIQNRMSLFRCSSDTAPDLDTKQPTPGGTGNTVAHGGR